jgi:histone-lysine N-methyltransferase SETMAR
MYTDILRRPRDAIRWKRPPKLRTNGWFLPHDNAPAQRSVLHKVFSAKNNVTTLKHPPYSPDLAAAHVYLFPRLKTALKGQRFSDAANKVKNATKELKRLSQNRFQECFQHLYSRWQKCIVAERDYFERKQA